MSRISVVIVSYKVPELLLACLHAIRKSVTEGPIEVIVVDNNSGDGSMEAVRNTFPEVNVIENRYNAGFSRANNQGIQLSSGEYIFLLNPDTEVEPEAIGLLARYLDAHPQTAVLAPKLLNTDGSLQISAWQEPGLAHLVSETFFLHKLISGGNYPKTAFRSIFEPASASGAALFFRKSLCNQIGMLDENLFWMEDVDFCVRARSIGSLVYLPHARVKHHIGQSQKKNYNLAICNQLLSKLKYLHKRRSRFIWMLAALNCLVFICTRIIAFSMASPFGTIYRLKAKAYLYSLGRFCRYACWGDMRLT